MINRAALQHDAVAAQKGDKVAYGRFLKAVAQYSTQLLRRKLHLADDVEDVCQDILISVDKALSSYDSTRPIMPWLHAIIQFRATDYMRKIYRNQARYYVEIDSIAHQLPDDTDVTERDADHEALYKQVGQLPEKQQEVVRLLKLEEYSVKEVAAMLGMSQSNVKVTAHRAYKQLRLRLKETV